MALTISAASTADHTPVTPAPPPNPVAVPRASDQPAPVQPSAGSNTQEAASLNRLLSRYRLEQAHGAAANTLSTLGRQILAAAKASGQHITLPRAPSLSGAAQPEPVAGAPPPPGKVNVTA
jgi:hypothetical protein